MATICKSAKETESDASRSNSPKEEEVRDQRLTSYTSKKGYPFEPSAIEI